MKNSVDGPWKMKASELPGGRQDLLNLVHVSFAGSFMGCDNVSPVRGSC